MKYLIIIFSFFISNVYSQARRDAVWCFGDSAQIDFNQNPPSISWCSTRSRGTACSIADSSGNLLFYCHTDYIPLWQQGYDKLGVVWNKNNEVMENGDSLVGDGWYQEMIIIPYPNDSNKYYLFHTGVTLNGQIYYSTIDLSYNNGLGKVSQKNILLDSLNGENVTDGINAIKHGNGRDWWLLFRTTGSGPLNKFYEFLITPAGIQYYPPQIIGIQSINNGIRLKFNNKGDKLLAIDNWGLFELFDFDRCNGNISNSKVVHSETSSAESEFFDAEFSPNDSLLYISTGGIISYLFQFNVSIFNIYTSKIIIDSTSFPIYAGGALKCAIDGKIYISKWWNDQGSFPFPYSDTTYNNYNMNLGVINLPNQIGMGCNYQPYSFFLGGKRTYVGLPNNPYYDMPALGGSVCDSLGLPNGIGVHKKKIFTIYPNPSIDKVYINSNLSEEPVGKMLVKIYDFTGKLIMETGASENVIDVSKLNSGIYTLAFILNGNFQSAYKISIVK